MYIISILAIIVMCKFVSDFSEAYNTFSWIFNYPILMVILLFNFSLLAGTGLLKDFNNAFRLSIWKKSRRESVNELRRAMEAVSLVIKVTFIIGIFLFFFEATQIVFSVDFSDPFDGRLGYMIVPGLVGPLYSAAIILILLPIESMLRLKLWNAQKSQEIQKEREIHNTLNMQENQHTSNEKKDQHTSNEKEYQHTSNEQEGQASSERQETPETKEE